MTRRNRWYEGQVEKSPGHMKSRLMLINVSIDQQCRYRDQCLAFAADAERRLETLKAEQLRLVIALGEDISSISDDISIT